MAIEKRKGKKWLMEDLLNDTTFGFSLKKVIVPPRKTDWQELSIVESPRFGRALVLDGVIQLTELDEALYHEFLVHWPLFNHSKPETVLIVGGGDGGAAREVLKHKSVKKVYLVDIDPMVDKMVARYMPNVPLGAFSDKRLTLLHEDAAKFIKKMANQIDVLILDSTDPVGAIAPSKALFGVQFMKDAHRALKKEGIMIRQTGSVVLQKEEFLLGYRNMVRVFGREKTRVVLISPVAFCGGYFSLPVAFKGKGNVSKSIVRGEQRARKAKIKTDWYSWELHKSSVILPPKIKKMIGA